MRPAQRNEAARKERASSTAVSRCFVALWPDPEACNALEALVRELHQLHAGSRPMARDNLHLTLAFIGALAETQARQVVHMLREIQSAPFTWTLDRCAGFERAHVLWAGGPEEPRLTALARATREGLDSLSIDYDRKPFAAHVTLLRNIAQVTAEHPVRPVAWQVTRPQLVVSERDAGGRLRYRTWVEDNLR